MLILDQGSVNEHITNDRIISRSRYINRRTCVHSLQKYLLCNHMAPFEPSPSDMHHVRDVTESDDHIHIVFNS